MAKALQVRRGDWICRWMGWAGDQNNIVQVGRWVARNPEGRIAVSSTPGIAQFVKDIHDFVDISHQPGQEIVWPFSEPGDRERMKALALARLVELIDSDVATLVR